MLTFAPTCQQRREAAVLGTALALEQLLRAQRHAALQELHEAVPDSSAGGFDEVYLPLSLRRGQERMDPAVFLVDDAALPELHDYEDLVISITAGLCLEEKQLVVGCE